MKVSKEKLNEIKRFNPEIFAQNFGILLEKLQQTRIALREKVLKSRLSAPRLVRLRREGEPVGSKGTYDCLNEDAVPEQPVPTASPTFTPQTTGPPKVIDVLRKRIAEGELMPIRSAIADFIRRTGVDLERQQKEAEIKRKLEEETQKPTLSVEI